MARCPHGRANIQRASIVDGPSGRRMRTWCPDCTNFVECVPKLNRRTGSVHAGEWVTVDFTIREMEIDPKPALRPDHGVG